MHTKKEKPVCESKIEGTGTYKTHLKSWDGTNAMVPL
jgi:hypothetical protein